MKRTIFFLILLIILQVATDALAEEQKKRWSDQAEFSLVDTGGNTNVTTLSAKNLLKVNFADNFVGSWKVGALYAKSDGVRTAENYSTELRLDYLFTVRSYSFGFGGWLKDTFAGIDNRYYGGAGAGYKFLDGPAHFLLGEAGLNYVKEDYTNDTESDYLQGRAFGQYTWAFTEKTRLSQSLEFLYDFSDSQNYWLGSVTAITTALTDSLALKASYEVKYDHQPVPETLRKTDTILTVALVVNF